MGFLGREYDRVRTALTVLNDGYCVGKRGTIDVFKNLQDVDLTDSSESSRGVQYGKDLTEHQRHVITTAEDTNHLGWRVLSLYAALTAHNQMVWICFSPIKDKTGIFFGLGEDLVIVDFASTLYMIVYLLTFLGSSYV